MVQRLLILLLLCFAGVLSAQEYALEVRAGVGDVVAPPYTQLKVTIMRSDSRPFVGRVVVDFSSEASMGGRRGRGRGRPPGLPSGADIQITQDVSLEEGAQGREVTLDVPVSGGFSPEVRLERQVHADYYEVVASTQAAAPFLLDERHLVGFVSSARLQMAQPYFHFRIAEIPLEELPESWKALTSFDAIVINDDRLSRAQSAALADYLTAGGTVILSPGTASSFNPETLAGTLLRIPSKSGSKTSRIDEYPRLLQKPLKSGQMAMGEETRPPENGMPPGEEQPGEEDPGEEQPRAHDPRNLDLEMPSGEARMVLWKEHGRAKPVPGYEGLISSARVGAGNLVFLHTDVSSGPFVLGDGMPTLASVNLLSAAHETTRGRIGHNPMALLMEKDVRRSIDIAGRRIPGRDALVILLLIYIAMAGVGMFIVARRIRKPELYPATLFIAALVSVGLVFGFGELYKRSGDRVKTVRILVSDETTERNAVFNLGCAYAVEGETYQFVNARSSTMLPAKLEYPGLSSGGMPADPFDFTTNFTAGEAHTEVRDLDRWQNVFFLQRDPANLEEFAIKVEPMSGGFKVENRSPHELRACVFVVGKTEVKPGEPNCEWHYVESLDAAGGESSITYTDSTLLPNDVPALANQMGEVLDDETIEVLGGMFNITDDDALGAALDFQQLEGSLMRAGLLPEQGEFLLMCVLPEDALDPAGIGAADVESDDIGQVNLWIVRGAVQGG